MGIDKETPVNYINLVLPGEIAFLKALKEQAEEDSQNEDLKEGEAKKMSLTLEKGSWETEEYYLDTMSGNPSPDIMVTGQIHLNGYKTWLSLSIPLSDEVLIDILQYANKKLNKLKTALETLS